MAFRYLIYSTGTTYSGTILRESATDNPGVNEASLYTDFVIPAIQPLYLWQVTGGTDVAPNTDQNISNYLEAVAPPPVPEDNASVGYVTGITDTKIDKVTGITNNLGIFNSEGNLVDGGYTIPELTGLTTYTFVGSGSTQITEDGNTITIYSTPPTGSTVTWGDITGTLSDQTDLQNALNAKLDVTDFNTYTGETETRLEGIENDLDTVSGKTDQNTLDIATLSGFTATKLDESVFTGYTATTQPIIDAALTGVTNLGTGTTLLTTSGRNVQSKSISVLGGLTLLGDANNIVISGGSAAVWGNISGTLSDQTDLWNTLTGMTAETATKLDSAIFDSYTGTTETRLQGIESDITFLSGETDLRLLITDFNAYTGTTETRLQGIESDITELSAVTTVAVTGATNGLTKVGQDVELGGALTKDTTISGLTENLTINTLEIDLQSAGGTGISLVDAGGTNITLESDGGAVELIGNTTGSAEVTKLSISETSMLITDGRGTPTGIQYADDYVSSFVARSLVDKAYVDAVATGLVPKASVMAATTVSDGNVDLTGGTFGGTIDGYTLLDGDRVLITQQTDDAENGIYDYTLATNDFTRSTDFDGTPDGEVVDGNLIPVVSGNTQYNTIWVLVTPNPITIDTTPLTFTLFSSPHELIAGTGISINANTISVDGTSLAGNSITWTGNTFNVDINSGTLSTALASKLDVTDFNSYSGNTDTRLDGIESDITSISAETATKLNISTFTGYTASTETRLSGIESDITYISGVTDSNFDIFTGYTANTETRLLGIEDDITGLSATTDTKLDTIIFTGYTASTVSNEMFLIHTGGTEVNTVAATAIEWDDVIVSGSSYSWTGGSDITILEAGSYEINYNVPYVSNQNNRSIGVGANVILNNNSVLDVTAAASVSTDSNIPVNIAIPTVILSLSANDKLTLAVYRTGDSGSATSTQNGSVLIKKKNTLQ